MKNARFIVFLAVVGPLFLRAETLTQKVSPPSSAARDTKLNLGLRFQGALMDEFPQSVRMAGGRMEADLAHQFLPELTGRLRAEMRLESGSAQTPYVDEFAPKQLPKLREAIVQWRPWNERVTLQVGALDEDKLDSPILISDQTFPGFSVSGKFPAGPFYVGLMAQQSVAASFASPVSSAWAGTTPLFLLVRAWAGFEPSENLKLEARVGYYSFHNLNESIAGRGRFFGNTVNGLGPSQANFIYGYGGAELGANIGVKNIGWRTIGLEPNLSGAYVENALSASGTNKALWLRAGLPIRLPDYRFGPRAEIFYLESDVVPAAYTAKEWGHLNRRGYSWGFEFEYLPKEWLFTAQYSEAMPIVANPLQNAFRYFSISLQTRYHVF